MSPHASRPGPVAELRGHRRGVGPLWKLCRVHGVGFSTLGGAVQMTASLRLLLPVGALFALLAVGLAHAGFILVSIWCSAFNIAGTPLGLGREVWGRLARVLTFGWALNAGGAALMLLRQALHA